MPLFPRQPLDPSSLDRTPEHQDQHRAPGAVPDAEPHIPRDRIQIHLEMEKGDPKTGCSQAFMNPRIEADKTKPTVRMLLYPNILLPA